MAMTKYFCILSLFICLSAHAQQGDIQVNQPESSTADIRVLQFLETSTKLVRSDPQSSLEYARQTQHLAESSSSDSLKAWILIKLGAIYYSHRALEEAEQVYLQANQYYLTVPEMVRQSALAYYEIGRLYKLMGRYGDALISFENCFALAKDMKDNWLQANLMRRTANILKHMGELENALEFANSSIELSHTHGFDYILAGAHTEAGFILNKLDQYSLAITELKLAISVADSTDYERLADASDGLGNVYSAQGLLDSALFYYLESMTFRSRLDDPESLHWNYLNIGLVYQKMEVFTSANEYFQFSLDYAREQQNEVMEGNSLLRLGRLEEDMGNTLAGLDHLLKAQNLLSSNGASGLELLSLKSLQRLFEKKGDFRTSMEYMHRLTKLERKIQSSESENRVEDMRVMYRTRLVEDEVRLLEQESKIKDLEADHLKRRMAITVMLFAFLLATAGYFVFLWMQKSKANRIIQERNSKLDEMNAKLLALNKTKDRLFSIIGHDLKNPINTITGFVDLLNRPDVNLTEETRNVYHGHITRSIRNISELLDSLLEWSRALGKTVNFKQQELDLDELIVENIALARATAEKKSIKLEFRTNEAVLVMADINMVNTVLRNLISNAIKFSNENRTVLVRTESAAKTVVVAVEDTGIGMSEEEVRSLFQVDVSVPRKGTSGESGTGLGLLICKEFVEKHNGTIYVSSKPGEGSTFSFDLPRMIS